MKMKRKFPSKWRKIKMKSYLLQFPVLATSSASASLSSRGTALLAASTRLGAQVLLGLLSVFLQALLELGVQLSGQLLVLVVKGPDAIDEHPVVPCVLPALVVHLVAMAVCRVLCGLDVDNLGFVQHVQVEAEDFLILAVFGGLLASWSHGEGC